MEPVLCVEPEERLDRAGRDALRAELLALGAAREHTAEIRDVRFFGALPVDTRHNAKIFREKLKVRVDRGRWR